MQRSFKINEVRNMAEFGLLVLIIAIIVFVFVIARQSPKPKHKQTRGRHVAHKHDTASSQPKPPRTKKDELDKLRLSKQFWGVEIHQPGCAAAAKLTGKQYPIASAPVLPVEGCASPVCTCLYMGLKDKRTLRRRLSHERRDELRFEPEKSDRRSHKDRRSSVEKWRNR
jgi:hypothetical protein